MSQCMMKSYRLSLGCPHSAALYIVLVDIRSKYRHEETYSQQSIKHQIESAMSITATVLMRGVTKTYHYNLTI